MARAVYTDAGFPNLRSHAVHDWHARHRAFSLRVQLDLIEVHVQHVIPDRDWPVFRELCDQAQRKRAISLEIRHLGS